MSYFNMDSKYSDDTPLTLEALYNEIADEENERNISGKRLHSAKDIAEKISSPKSGLRVKLKSKLGFDLEPSLKAGKSEYEKREKHCALKLLKFLYRIEKEGMPKKQHCSLAQKRVRIIDILSKPSFENVLTTASSNNICRAVFQHLYDIITLSVSYDAKKIQETIADINEMWEKIYREVLLLTFAGDSICLGNSTTMNARIKEMDIVFQRLKIVTDRLPEVCPAPCRGGVFKSFFTLLECHKCLCYEVARKDYFLHELPPNLSSETIARLRSEEYNVFSWNDLDRLEQYVSKQASNDETAQKLTNFLLELVFDNRSVNNLSHDDWLSFCLAVKYARRVIPWIKKYKGNVVDYEDRRYIPKDMYVCILQEIIFVSQADIKFKNNYFGYNYSYQPILAALKHPERASESIIQIWSLRLQNRVAIAHGRYEFLRLSGKIIECLFKLKEFIFRHHNMDTITQHHQFLFVAYNCAANKNSVPYSFYPCGLFEEEDLCLPHGVIMGPENYLYSFCSTLATRLGKKDEFISRVTKPQDLILKLMYKLMYDYSATVQLIERIVSQFLVNQLAVTSNTPQDIKIKLEVAEIDENNDRDRIYRNYNLHFSIDHRRLYLLSMEEVPFSQ